MSAGRESAENRIVRAGMPLSKARRAAVLVHGRDQDEQVMLDLAERLALDDVAYLLPVAARHTWYDGRYRDPVADNEPDLGRALQTIERALALARGTGFGPGAVVLGGFSQGACLVAELIARAPRPLGGLAILTGALLGPPAERREPHDVDGLAVYASCSVHDAWIPIDDARATAQAFAGAGADVHFEELDDREHLVSDRAVDGVRRLLAAG